MRQATAFEQRVWLEVQSIPWGETRTYGEVARAVGSYPHPTGMALARISHFPATLAITPWWRVTRSNRRMPVNKRTREQAGLLLLEGHVIVKQGKSTYRVLREGEK